MHILGISAFYHDSAAALVTDGRIVAAAQEERFSRKKHDARYPHSAVEYCLAEAGIQLNQVDHVAFYDKPFLKFERLLETYVAFAPRGFQSFRMAIPLWLREKLFLKDLLIKKLKESAPDSRRFTDLINAFGDRFVLFAGLDDVAFEGLTLGARGWVSGLTNAFPAESLALYEALKQGDLERARKIYRWFMPLLHLDAEYDLVQSIKLAEQIMGRGSERVRPPRLPLRGRRRAEVTAMVELAAATRPG